MRLESDYMGIYTMLITRSPGCLRTVCKKQLDTFYYEKRLGGKVKSKQVGFKHPSKRSDQFHLSRIYVAVSELLPVIRAAGGRCWTVQQSVTEEISSPASLCNYCNVNPFSVGKIWKREKKIFRQNEGGEVTYR